MKVLMIMMTMLVATSTYAEACKVGVKCDKPADCTALGADHAVNAAGFCVNTTAGEKKLEGCPKVVEKGAPNEKKKIDTGTGTVIENKVESNK